MNKSDLIELFSQPFLTIISTAVAVTHSSFLLQNKMLSIPPLLLTMLQCHEVTDFYTDTVKDSVDVTLWFMASLYNPYINFIPLACTE